MDKIASFTVDHEVLEPGIYVSRIDQDPNTGCFATTFDIRMTAPNREEVLDTAAIHAIEHLGATFLRNNPEWKDRTIYFGPMGCRTGFYLVVFGRVPSKEIVPAVRGLCNFISKFEGEIPGATPKECGNWSDSDLDLAKKAILRFVENTLDGIDDEHMFYPGEAHLDIESSIGIMAAMDAELDMLAAQIDDPAFTMISGVEFIEGTIEDKPIVLAKCGVGKVNAALTTQIMIDHFGIESIINTGVAGAIDEDLEIGDIVIAEDAVHHDMNAQVLGYNQGEIPMAHSSVFRTDVEISEILHTAANMLGASEVTTGHVVSGDIFVSDPEIKQFIADNFDAKCCDMESAAIAQVCVANNIPFGIVRTISDTAEGDVASYTEFEEETAQTAAQIITSFLEFEQ